MAGGAGVEYYFGYAHENSDLTCEDFRSRANMWVQSKNALDFFSNNAVPFQNMSNDNSRISPGNWCLVDDSSRGGPVIVVYLRNGGTANINLTGLGENGSSLDVYWYDPRNGGKLQSGSVSSLEMAGFPQSLGNAPHNKNQDWVVLLQ